MVRAVVVALALAGCAYRADSFAYSGHPFAGQRTTIGCLDVALDRRNDGEGVAVVAYDFGNRCDQNTMVDLAYATVTGRTESGEQVVLSPYDPRHEIRPLRLGGRTVGSETIAYESEHHLAQICVDVATIAHAPGAPKVVCASSPPPMKKTPSAPLDTGPAKQASDPDLPSPADAVEPPNE